MKTITTNNRRLIFVEVPDGAIAELMHVDNTGLFTCLDCMVIFSGNPPEPDHGEWCTLLEVQLPTGNYRLIATTDTITEQQAAMFVKEDEDDGYVPFVESERTYSHALSAFEALLQHHSITGRHAIIGQL